MNDKSEPSEFSEAASIPSAAEIAVGHPSLDTVTSRTLHRRFARKDAESPAPGGRLADLYLGAKMARRFRENPECMAQCAHSIRELIDALPSVYPGVPVFNHADLSTRARRLVDVWTTYEEATPATEVNGLAQFEDEMRGFVKEMDGVRTTRRMQAGALLNAMDPSGRPLPPSIAELHIKDWGRYRDFFTKVSHHGPVEAEEFDRRLDLFEIFLVGLFGLQTITSQSQIQAIIAEGEANAGS